jgi:hypothetical protein
MTVRLHVSWAAALWLQLDSIKHTLCVGTRSLPGNASHCSSVQLMRRVILPGCPALRWLYTMPGGTRQQQVLAHAGMMACLSSQKDPSKLTQGLPHEVGAALRGEHRVDIAQYRHRRRYQGTCHGERPPCCTMSRGHHALAAVSTPSWWDVPSDMTCCAAGVHEPLHCRCAARCIYATASRSTVTQLLQEHTQMLLGRGIKHVLLQATL